MSTSQKQLEANRRNAQRSTGPRTPEGKVKSSLNATKHGILSREAIVVHPNASEDAGEFDSLLSDLTLDFSPHGSLEELLVQQVAICYWRLRRTLRAESQEWGQVLAAQQEPLEALELYGQTTPIPHATLPPCDRVETLLRYEKSIQAQLSRSLAHLDRLQRQRPDQPGDLEEDQNVRNEPISVSPCPPTAPPDTGDRTPGLQTTPNLSADLPEGSQVHSDQTNPFLAPAADPAGDHDQPPAPTSASLSRSSLPSLLT